MSDLRGAGWHGGRLPFQSTKRWKGMGLKSHDYRIAALCFSCHANIDQGKSLNKEERKEIWDEAHRRTIGWLFEGGHLTVG